MSIGCRCWLHDSNRFRYAFKHMIWLAALALLMSFQAQTPPQLEPPDQPTITIEPPGPAQQLTTLSFSGVEFVEAFNAASNLPRLVLIMSPG
jgi:hypothetical protein